MQLGGSKPAGNTHLDAEEGDGNHAHNLLSRNHTEAAVVCDPLAEALWGERGVGVQVVYGSSLSWLSLSPLS